MSSPVQVPETTQQLVKRLRDLEEKLARAIIQSHHRFWPKDLNGSYRVIHRNGKVKVELLPPQQHEAGWRDE